MFYFFLGLTVLPMIGMAIMILDFLFGRSYIEENSTMEKQYTFKLCRDIGEVHSTISVVASTEDPFKTSILVSALFPGWRVHEFTSQIDEEYEREFHDNEGQGRR